MSNLREAGNVMNSPVSIVLKEGNRSFCSAKRLSTIARAFEEQKQNFEYGGHKVLI